MFVDTNVLVYAHDIDAASKRETARAVLRDLWDARKGVVSPQVLQEFYVTVTRKIPKSLAKKDARTAVDTYATWCIDIGPDDLRSAFRIEDEAKIGFWDALILAAAAKSGAGTLLSEDLSDRQTISGVRVVNPFRA